MGSGSNLKGRGWAAEPRRLAAAAAGVALVVYTVVPLVAATAVFVLKRPIADMADSMRSFVTAPPWFWWPNMLALGEKPAVILGALAAAAVIAAAAKLSIGSTGLAGSTALLGQKASMAHVYGSAAVDSTRSALEANTPTWERGERPDPSFGGGSLVLGYDSGRYYVSAETVHAVVYGPPGFGKSRSILIPSIYYMAHCGDSLVITDPQGEIYSKMHRFLESMGYECPIVDLKNTKRSWLWNPLAPIVEVYRRHMVSAREHTGRALDLLALAPGAEGPERERIMGEYRYHMSCADTDLQDAATSAQRYAMDLASCIVPEQGERTDASFWNDSSRGVITSVVLFVCTYDRESVLIDLRRERDAAPEGGAMRRIVERRIAELPPAIADEQRTLATVYSLLSEQTGTVQLSGEQAKVAGKREMLELERLFDVLPADHPANWAFGQMRKSSGQTLMNMVSSAINDLRRSIPGPFNEISYRSEFDLSAIGRDKTALFIVTPPKNPELATPAVILLNQVFNNLVDSAEANGGAVARRTQMILEEFGNLPRPIPGLANNLAVCRKYDVHYTLCVQNWALVEEKYGRVGTASLRDTISTTIYLGTESPEMAREVSERIGVETIERVSTSTSVDGGVFNTRRTTSKSYDKRDWMTASEAMSWNARYLGTIVFRSKNDIEPRRATGMVNPAIFPYADVSETTAEQDLQLGRKYRRQIEERMVEDESIDRRATRPKRLSVWRAGKTGAAPAADGPFPDLPSAEVEAFVHKVAFERWSEGDWPEIEPIGPTGGARDALGPGPGAPGGARGGLADQIKEAGADRKRMWCAHAAMLSELADRAGVEFEIDRVRRMYKSETDGIKEALRRAAAEGAEVVYRRTPSRVVEAEAARLASIAEAPVPGREGSAASGNGGGDPPAPEGGRRPLIEEVYVPYVLTKEDVLGIGAIREVAPRERKEA